MTKYFTCIILLPLICFSAAAQSIDSTLNVYSNNFPQEKIHLHTDKESYFAGETIWFKAYIFADNLPTNMSTNLYADLVETNGKLVEHKTMPILSASSDSYFKLPDTAADRYIIRVYTTWMLNFDTAFIYNKTINIVKDKGIINTVTDKPATSLQFFAEGGNMVAGQYNYIAFKATQSDGIPYSMNAVVKNSKGVLIDSIATVHDGMGLLKFTPEENETYTAEWKDNKNENRRTTLPNTQSQGIVLHAEQVQHDLYYIVSAQGATANEQELTVRATMFQQLVYKAAIKMKQASVNQKLSTKDFPTGILQLTVFNKENQPLAERILFINNNNYTFTARVNLAEKSVAKRGKNKIDIEIPDTLNNNLSIAVYDASLEQQANGRNIYTDLLLQGDIKGYVYDADWYFNDTATHRAEYLDLVMQTNGWRRYNWEQIAAGLLPKVSFLQDNFLSIYGKVTNDKQKALAKQLVNFRLQTRDSSKQWLMPVTNAEGVFTQSGLIFYDTATIFYKMVDKGVAIGMAKDYNGLSTLRLGGAVTHFLQSPTSTELNNSYSKTFITQLKNKDPEFEKNAKLLNEVVVKANKGWNNWKADPLLKMDEKYASGSFRGGSTGFAFDLLHDEHATDRLDIYDYLSGKVPGMKINFSNMGKTVLVPSPSGGGAYVVPNIYVNENLQDNEYLRTLSIEDIAYVKYFEHSYGRVAAEQQAIATLAIYLKTGKDNELAARAAPGSLTKLKIAGYSPLKEFYSPDYSTPNDKQANVDLRTTLLWQPYIITNKDNKKASVVFYNNDITTKLKVVIEGMNDDGKLIHIEKIIE